MTGSPRRQAPACYRLRVDGHLDDHWSAWFGDLTLAQESDGTTSSDRVGHEPDSGDDRKVFGEHRS
ncbi:hypothetical protein [Nonomuraea sp. LPB2021202275-12-8]|uniref:hypothetical protein n=1 Tax=Nonomuraea sp. LPB2021202275-12-8 TaxID=3120159 RepID=UPI00300C7E12